MIIRYLNVVRIAISPDKANAPLIIDSNAVLTRPITLQLFQSISWRHSQLCQGLSAALSNKSLRAVHLTER